MRIALHRLGRAMVCAVYAILLSLSPLVVDVFTGDGVFPTSLALADDDDGDSDGDDDDGDDWGGGVDRGGGLDRGGGVDRGGSARGSRGSSSRVRGEEGSLLRLFGIQRTEPRRTQRQRSRPSRQRARPARPAPPPPARAPREIVALGLGPQDLAILVADGYTVLQQDTVARLGAEVVRLDVPAGTSLEDARAEVEALNDAAVADFNHFYRPVERWRARTEPCQALSCGAARLIDWPAAPGSAGTCAAGVVIGMVDTGINPDHHALRDRDLTILPFDLDRPDTRGSSRQHGTAVAAIILANAASRAPGLVPDAKVYAVDAFFRTAGGPVSADERTDAFTLVRALDAVSQRPVTVLNLSLAGPANTLLERMVADIGEASVVIVASVGNSGPRGEPMYPAAYDGVIGVTAVDHRASVFRRAPRGAHVDFAAPGVEVWTAASVRGIKPKTGTSFASPFVTAVVAHALGRGANTDPAGIVEALRADAKDLGAPGRDDVFGFGLVQAGPPCGPPEAATAPSAEPRPASLGSAE